MRVPQRFADERPMKTFERDGIPEFVTEVTEGRDRQRNNQQFS